MYNIIGTVLSGRYRIESFINKGGMSYIYLAYDIAAEKSVVLKVLKEEYLTNEDFLRRFNYEAFAGSKLNHPNIVKIYDVGIEGDIRYICMEYVEGQTLKEYIAEKKVVDSQVACDITNRILSALQHAHSKGIIHRDIKPQNILIDKKRNIKVSDFGIAHIDDAPSLTMENVGIGTAQYVSPEQAKGDEVSAASDLYSTGIVLYEMLTGQLPFDGESAVITIMQHLTTEPVPASRINPLISPEIEAVVTASMQKDIKNRYKSALEMAKDLQDAKLGIYPSIAKELLESKTTVVEEIPKPEPVPHSQSIVQTVNLTRQKKKKLTLKWKVFIVVFSALLVAIIAWGINYIVNVTRTVYSPDLIGLRMNDAVKVAHDNDLVPQVVFLNHNSVPENQVISQVPIIGKKMYRGDGIVLSVSKGKETYLTPNFVGMDAKQAIEIAGKTGFTINIVERSIQPEAKIGTIYKQSPEAGSRIVYGGTIQVHVSENGVVVPDLTNLSQDEAAKHLEDFGLQLGQISFEEVSDESKSNTVISQSPKIGTEVIKNTWINVTVGIMVNDYVTSATFNLPKMDDSFLIKITLKGDDGEETSQFVAMHSATASDNTTITVPLRSKESGTKVCNLYINDSLVDSVEVNLQWQTI